MPTTDQLSSWGKKIQIRTRELKEKNKSLKHKDAIKEAGKQLKEEGAFSTKKENKTPVRSRKAKLKEMKK